MAADMPCKVKGMHCPAQFVAAHHDPLHMLLDLYCAITFTLRYRMPPQAIDGLPAHACMHIMVDYRIVKQPYSGCIIQMAVIIVTERQKENVALNITTRMAEEGKKKA